MQEKFIIKSKEQLDLISDPFVISILGALQKDPVTVDWLAEELEEKISLVTDYLDQLHRVGLLELKEDENGVPRYYRIAESYELHQFSEDYQSELYNDWVIGFTHHLASNYVDLLDIFSKFSNPRKELEQAGFGEPILSNSKIYLTRKEYDGFLDYLKSFISKHREKAQTDDAGVKKPYDLTYIVNPELPALKKLTSQKKDK